MREVQIRAVPGVEAVTRIEATDEPGPGGANHKYQAYVKFNGQWEKSSVIAFQKGPVEEKGPNGLQNEDLLSIVLDRLNAFQYGSLPCKENTRAIAALEEALLWLHARTADRISRRVEGKSEK